MLTKSRTGFLIALVAALTIPGVEALTKIDFLSRNDTFVCIGLGLLGFLGWLTGRVREASRTESSPVPDAAVGEVTAGHPLVFLVSLKYWGIILVLLAGILSCLVTWRRHKPTLVARANPLPAPAVKVTNEAPSVVFPSLTVTNEAPRLVFPSLELQGVVVNGEKSCALINGRVLFLGEAVSNAVLVAVDSEHASMAMEGQTNVLVLRR